MYYKHWHEEKQGRGEEGTGRQNRLTAWRSLPTSVALLTCAACSILPCATDRLILCVSGILQDLSHGSLLQASSPAGTHWLLGPDTGPLCATTYSQPSFTTAWYVSSVWEVGQDGHGRATFCLPAAHTPNMLAVASSVSITLGMSLTLQHICSVPYMPSASMVPLYMAALWDDAPSSLPWFARLG